MQPKRKFLQKVASIAGNELIYGKIVIFQECSNIFSSGGGKALSEMAGIPFLGAIPIDPRVSSVRKGSIMAELKETAVASSFVKVLDTLVDSLEEQEKPMEAA